MTFSRFVAIDWSGARGERLNAIAVAEANAGNDPPRLLAPPDGGLWSRAAVGDFLAELSAAGDALIGADFSFSLPYMDANAYFPNRSGPDRAGDVWHLVDQICVEDPHFYAGSFVTSPDFAAHFRRPGMVGDAFMPRLRQTEALCRANGYGPAQSVYNLIGPAQVGLASLSGMRLLARMRDSASSLAIWPFDRPLAGQSCMVEMYTRLFLRRAGAGPGKVRDGHALNAALGALGSGSLPSAPGSLSDHETDVLISAAGLREMVRTRGAGLWNPRGLSDKVRVTEGWTFGVG